MPDTAPFRLTIPPRAEYVATARLFAATVARVLELDETLVEDLKLATSELVSLAILGGTDAPVVVTVVPHEPMTLSVTPVDPSAYSGPAVAAPVDIVGAVFSEVEIASGGVTVTFGLEPTV